MDKRGVELRLERASEHIDALRHEARMFMMAEPQAYGMRTDDKPLESGEYIIRAKVFRPPPPRMGIIAADAAHNLRASLDMIAWQLPKKIGAPAPDDDTQTAFPICSDDSAWESRSTKRMIEWIDDDAVGIIKALQPYDRPIPECYKLQVVQSIDNWAKHKAIPGVLTFHVSSMSIISNHRVTSAAIGAFDDGDELCRVPPLGDRKESFKAKLMCHVGLAKEAPGFGLPLEALGNSYEYIRDTVLPAFSRFFE
jgi:hypothetical protein